MHRLPNSTRGAKSPVRITFGDAWCCPRSAAPLVTHSAVICLFDGAGAARLLIAWLGSAHPDIEGTAADLQRIVDETLPNRAAEIG